MRASRFQIIRWQFSPVRTIQSSLNWLDCDFDIALALPSGWCQSTELSHRSPAERSFQRTILMSWAQFQLAVYQYQEAPATQAGRETTLTPPYFCPLPIL